MYKSQLIYIFFNVCDYPKSIIYSIIEFIIIIIIFKKNNFVWIFYPITHTTMTKCNNVIHLLNSMGMTHDFSNLKEQ